MKKILVTGGAGYIGSHTVQALKDAGYTPIVLDNLSYSDKKVAEEALQVPLIIGDTRDRALLDDVFSQHSFEAVFHFAAFISVGESTQDPAKYYRNNVEGTLTLLEAMVHAKVNSLIFSSTAATFGTPEFTPLTEEHPQKPINPYGHTKLMVEQILRDFDTAYGLKSVIFRYFNAAGAHPSGHLGENHEPETHLIPLILQTAAGSRPSVSIFGNDYATPDGTCIRDYVHVSDLASAHLLGFEYLQKTRESNDFNLGNGKGFSVQEVIQAAELETGRKVSTLIGPRRAGDPAILVASSQKAQKVLGWKPQLSDLGTIMHHAWEWEKKKSELAN